jgi:hypothetical protein
MRHPSGVWCSSNGAHSLVLAGLKTAINPTDSIVLGWSDLKLSSGRLVEDYGLPDGDGAPYCERLYHSGHKKERDRGRALVRLG